MVRRPKPREADTLLLTAERSPNLRGARELGFELAPARPRRRSRNGSRSFSDLRDRPPGAFPDGRCPERPGPGPGQVSVRRPRRDPWDDAVDFILPDARSLPKSRDRLTNTEGLVQEFRPVWPPPGEARPEGRSWPIWRVSSGPGKHGWPEVHSGGHGPGISFLRRAMSDLLIVLAKVVLSARLAPVADPASDLGRAEGERGHPGPDRGQQGVDSRRPALRPLPALRRRHQDDVQGGLRSVLHPAGSCTPSPRSCRSSASP